MPFGEQLTRSRCTNSCSTPFGETRRFFGPRVQVRTGVVCFAFARVTKGFSCSSGVFLDNS